MASKPPRSEKARGRENDLVRRAEAALCLHDRELNQIEQPEINAAALGLLAWGRKFLPAHFSRRPSRMHEWLSEELAHFRKQRGKKLNVIGPRGSAKSTIASLAFILRAALEAAEPYIWLVSDTKQQAITHLDNLKGELTDNKFLAAEYSKAVGVGRVWRSAAIVLKNGVTIEAYGTGQRIRGRRRRANRPTLIVADDLQNDSHISSAFQREKSAAWFHGTLLPAGTKRTNVLHLATALHREALALQLHSTPGWNSRIFRAIERWPDNLSLWHEWEMIYANLENPHAKEVARAFYDEHSEQMNAGAELLWPDEEDLYTLMCLRIESGRTAFEREKQSCPLNPELCEWPEEYFAEHLWFDEWPPALQLRVIALDPSKGSDARRGDFSAFVLLGVAADGRLYVEADLARRPTPQIVADGTELCRVFRPDAFGVEANQFQELLAGEFAAEFARQGLLGLQPWTLDNRVNKLVRIRRLGPLLSARRLRFKAKSLGTKLLVDQLKDFPAGDHDDGPDALEMAIRLASEMLSGTPDDGLGTSLVKTC